MENKIELVFDKATTRLAGNPYGRTVYKEQIAEKMDYDKMNIISFPDNIEKVASSFTQGLFSEIIEKIGYSGFKDTVTIKAKTDALEKMIYEDLFY